MNYPIGALMPPDNFTSKVRTREITPKSGTVKSTIVDRGTIFGSPFTSVVQNHEEDWKLGGKQITASEGHPTSSFRTGDDVGGPFDTVKYSIGGVGSVNIDYSQPTGIGNTVRQFTYDGAMLPFLPGFPGSLPFPPSYESSDDDLFELGSTAIARVNPGNPIMSLSTTLGELRSEGLPHLVGHTTWESRANAAQKAGDEYLNVQFGWAPLVSDVRNFASTVANYRAVLEQYEKDAGKRVRRRYNFPSESFDEVQTFPGVSPYAFGTGANFIETLGTGHRHRKVLRDRWFSGAFTYYLPEGYNSRSEVDRMALLANRLGLDLGPDTLWNLSPWSWAVDWFSNTGDVLKNINQFQIDGNVLAYAYIMEHTIVIDTYTIDGLVDTRGQSVEVPPLSLVTETKKRRKANPYGFGHIWDNLSPFQLSILAALGIKQHGR